MNHDPLIANIQAHAAEDQALLAELYEKFNAELKKPAKKRDYQLIDELTAAIYEATSEQDLEQVTQQGIAAISAAHAQRVKSHPCLYSRWLRPVAVLCTCLAVVLGLNVWTTSAFHMNLFKTVYQIADGGISISVTDAVPEVSLEKKPDDPYGLRAECEKYGFSPRVPEYIPEDFKLVGIDEMEDDTEGSLYFRYVLRQKRLNIGFEYLDNPDDYLDTSFGCPSDHYNVIQENLDGIDVVISWEDRQFTAMFTADHIIYSVSSIDLDYDEAYAVLRSFF